MVTSRAAPAARRTARRTVRRTAGADLAVHLRRARDHIDRLYAAPLDLDRLAGVAGVSKYHFVRCSEAS